MANVFRKAVMSLINLFVYVYLLYCQIVLLKIQTVMCKNNAAGALN